MNPNIPNLIMMIRPKHFGFNHETAASNSFQNNALIQDISAKAQVEFDLMVAVLESANISVKVFEDLDVELPDSIFPNNWISHIPYGPLVVYPMYTLNRRAEVRSDIIEWCKARLSPTSIIDISDLSESGSFLEGTGSIVFDHENKLAYACLSARTDLKLLRSLTTHLGYSCVSFKSVDTQGQEIYHTNVMMSICSSMIFICLDSIEDNIERNMLKASLAKSSKEIIQLTFPQINSFAGNTFEVANK
jgi:hypothetical protein